jgi:hypothetical protein
MSSRSLSSILGRAAGHDALLELLELAGDVKAIRSSLVKIGNRVADSGEPIDEAARCELVQAIGRAIIATNKIDRAYDALDAL